MNIVVGITGGIAAYKTLTLIRLLVKAGHAVKVVITKNGLQFVTQITLETLSQHKVYSDTFAEKSSFSVDHVALADWADLVVIAPARANIIAKMVAGIADDALSTFLVVAHQKKTFFAPAMNNQMWENPVVQQNIAMLKERGVSIIQPDAGFLACGTSGNGRMAEPETIFEEMMLASIEPKHWHGRTVLITAGPTFEPIDPVRFIGNHSSGLMGFCIAEVFAKYGAQVHLVSGPSHLTVKNKNITLHKVQTAQEMFEKTISLFPETEVAVMAAAVADYTPKVKAAQKIKKGEEEITLTLIKNPDILAHLGHHKQAKQKVVGFALETNNEIENARKKLVEKKCDLIVLNKMHDPGAAFHSPTNHVYLITPNAPIKEIPLQAKELVACEIVNAIEQYR